MAVTHCICSSVSFVELKNIADEHKIKTIEELRRIKPFGLSCKLCVPYVRQMLRDGRTAFDTPIIE